MAYVLGDAHCLPFRSNIFHMVYSYSLLEHLQNPILAINEQVCFCKRIINTQIPNLQHFIELHTKAPLLYYYPNTVKKRVIEITNPNMCLNFSVIYENVIRWFFEAGAKMVKCSEVYLAKWARVFLMP